MVSRGENQVRPFEVIVSGFERGRPPAAAGGLLSMVLFSPEAAAFLENASKCSRLGSRFKSSLAARVPEVRGLQRERLGTWQPGGDGVELCEQGEAQFNQYLAAIKASGLFSEIDVI